MLISVHDMNVDLRWRLVAWLFLCVCMTFRLRRQLAWKREMAALPLTVIQHYLVYSLLFCLQCLFSCFYVRSFTCMWRVCLCELTIKTCATTSSVLRVSLLASRLLLHLGRLQTLWKMLQPGHVTFWHQNLSPFCSLIAMKGYSGLGRNLQNVCIACKTQESK